MRQNFQKAKKRAAEQVAGMVLAGSVARQRCSSRKRHHIRLGSHKMMSWKK